jgi:hypothetical protein
MVVLKQRKRLKPIFFGQTARNESAELEYRLSLNDACLLQNSADIIMFCACGQDSALIMRHIRNQTIGH